MFDNKHILGKMSAEEFMEHCFDSAPSSADDEEIEDVKTEVENSSSHKSQLSRLKDKDPEFYKFLQENDVQLLHFSESDDDNSILSEDGKHDTQDAEEEPHDDVHKERMIVTDQKAQKWKLSLAKGSLKTLRTVLDAFHDAVEVMSPDDDEQENKEVEFVVQGIIFNNLVAMCLKYVVPIIEKHLDYSKAITNRKKVQLPSSSQQWTSIKVIVKRYLLDILQLLRQLTHPTILSVILRHCQLLCPYHACFPKICKMFLKRLIRMWSTGEEHVRVLSFFCIRKIILLTPNLFEFAIKKMYLSFVRNSKFVNASSQPLVVFMRNSMVEMFALNEQVTYQNAFVYIRQLAIHLRNAITVKKKDSHQAVYNWQYMSCLHLWTQVVARLVSDVIKPLVYPVVQIILGVIRLIPAPRHYPIRFKCIELLNDISEKTGTYIPIAGYVLEVLESEELYKKPKSTEKPPDYSKVLKFSKTQLQTKGFQDLTIDMAFEALLRHYVIFSNSIAFPELIFPVCHRLKRAIKRSKFPKLCKDVKVLLERLRSHGEFVTKARLSVSFAPKDLDKVKEWEGKQERNASGMLQFFESWKLMRDSVKQPDSSENHVAKKKKSAKRKIQNVQKNEIEEGTKRKKLVESDDILEDFRLSDSD